MRLQEGDDVTLTYAAIPGQFSGKIVNVDLRRQLTELGRPVMDAEAVISAEVTIAPEDSAPIDWIGKPVGARIDVFGGSWLGRLFKGEG
jgi:hypothetical protein